MFYPAESMSVIWRNWCKGSTTDCGSVCIGSNPVFRPINRPKQQTYLTKYMSLVRFQLFKPLILKIDQMVDQYSYVMGLVYASVAQLVEQSADNR